MRIAIDTSPTSSTHSYRGVGLYTKRLIEALKTYQDAHTILQFDATKQKIPVADVIHFPFFDPFFLTLPMGIPVPCVVTVHDLIPLVFPEQFPKGLRGKIKWEMQKASLRQKQHVITDSQCSKKDIVRLTGIQDKKIDVIYLAPSLPTASQLSETIAPDIQLDLPDKYFLAVGDVNWNKNIPGLLRSFAQIIGSLSDKIKLVLVGKAYLDSTLPEVKDIKNFITELGIGQHVVFTGYVSERTLFHIYKRAVALVQPSFYEGFGFPVLDAMACGCPVISSGESSLNEIAGPSLIIHPQDIRSIGRAMKSMLSMETNKRAELIAKGHLWVKQFTWEKTAKKTIEVYEKVLGTK